MMLILDFITFVLKQQCQPWRYVVRVIDIEPNKEVWNDKNLPSKTKICLHKVGFLQ